MSETAFLSEDDKIRRLLSEIVDAYHDLYPSFCEHFDAFVKAESSGLHKANGMSDDGNFMTYCKIPANLHHFIKNQVYKKFDQRIFFSNYHDYKLFTDVWKTAKVKKKSTPYLFLDTPS